MIQLPTYFLKKDFPDYSIHLHNAHTYFNALEDKECRLNFKDK